MSIEGGPSLVFSTSRRARFSSFDTSTPETGSRTQAGFVAGARIAVPLAGRYAMLFRVRLTRASREGDTTAATGMTAGAGITVAISRRGRIAALRYVADRRRAPATAHPTPPVA